jgi:5-amino-6-(5-phosphoribosylamino)uracil reductase
VGWTERFAALADRKAAEARAAELSPFITDGVPDAGELLPVGNDWSRHLFDGSFHLSPPPSVHLPAVSLVFVQSRDGNTGASDPSALGGGATDKHLIYEGLTRVAADAVLAGAETVRGGDLVFSTWHPELVALRQSLGLPRHPVQIVATLRGIPIDDGLIFNVPDLRVIVVTVPGCTDLMRAPIAARPWITPVVMPTPQDLANALRQLRSLGIGRISCVGGRTIAGQLIDAGLIQDLYLTTSPKAGGEPNTPMYPRPLETERVLRKHGTGADVGVVFEHSKVRLKPERAT